MPVGGYLSGSRAARSTVRISNHKQCGGPKKQGLAPSSGYYRGSMGNLKIWKGCGCTGLARLNNTIKFKSCKDIPSNKFPSTSGGVGTMFKIRN